jgi:hypothetical protein
MMDTDRNGTVTLQRSAPRGRSSGALVSAIMTAHTREFAEQGLAGASAAFAAPLCLAHTGVIVHAVP